MRRSREKTFAVQLPNVTFKSDRGFCLDCGVKLTPIEVFSSSIKIRDFLDQLGLSSQKNTLKIFGRGPPENLTGKVSEQEYFDQTPPNW